MIMRDEFIKETLRARSLVLVNMIIKQQNKAYSNAVNGIMGGMNYEERQEYIIDFRNELSYEVIEFIARFLWDAAKSNRYSFKYYKSTVFNFIRDLLNFISSDNAMTFFQFKEEIYNLDKMSALCKKNKLYDARLKHLCEYCRCLDVNIPTIYDIPVENYDKISKQNNRLNTNVHVEENMKEKGIINFLELFAYYGTNEGYMKFNDMLMSPAGHNVKYYLDISGIKDLMIKDKIVCFFKEMTEIHGDNKCFYQTYIRDFIKWVEDDLTKNDYCYEWLIDNAENIMESKRLRRITKMFSIYCRRKDSRKGEYYENDFWDIGELKLSSERINLTSKVNYICFTGIKGENNKIHIKDYCKYLIQNTNLGISTIYERIMNLKRVTCFLDKFVLDLNADDLEHLIEISPSTRMADVYLYSLKGIAEYYTAKNKNCIGLLNLIGRYVGIHKRKNIVSADPKYVIVQIFNTLDMLAEDDQLFFLIIYCTGMRASEVCLLERNCLHKNGKKYYINFYQQKMRKDVQNEIPKELYFRMKRYIEGLPKNKTYIFSKNKTKDVPGNTRTYVDRLGREFKRLGIKNVDGSTYHFKSHAFRHLMAVDMSNAKIPQPFIQEQLHHSSPEMTLAYLEYIDKKKIADMKNPIDYQGNRLIDEKAVENVTQDDFLSYKRKDIDSLIVMGGVCGRPKKLGVCQKGNMCLYCEHFRTSVEFLPVLKKMLAEIDGLLDRIGDGDDDLLTLKMKRDKKALLQIILKLEEGV